MNNTFYVTTPIYYVNDKPHIGHAYTTVACDVIARFKRLDGYSVKFLTGTDEHGQKVAKAAVEHGVGPKEFTDEVSKSFKDLAKTLNCSNDDFIRTTELRHTESCQAIWECLKKKTAPDGKPWIVLDKYSGWYSMRDEAFHTEDELVIGSDNQKLAPNGNPVEWVEEESYFFRLSQAEDILLSFYEANSDFIAPITRLNEIVSFVRGGLQDLSISRTTFDWGVPVPGDSKHVMYVWIDALVNYLTAVGYPDTESNDYKTFWPCDLHMIGKDIIRFHCVYWPAFLIAAGLPLPKRIFAHGWWTIEGQKMSKSLGNAIDPSAIINSHGLDQLRYFLLREVPFGKDGDFSKASLVNRSNGELANDLGNLSQRVLSMVYKNCGQSIPQPADFSAEDTALINSAHNMLSEVRVSIDKQAYADALEAIWVVVRASNSYVDKQAPWQLHKINSERMNTVLFVLMEVLRLIGLIMQPFTPDSASHILDQLGISSDERSFSFFSKRNALSIGKHIDQPKPIFKKLELDPENPL